MVGRPWILPQEHTINFFCLNMKKICVWKGLELDIIQLAIERHVFFLHYRVGNRLTCFCDWKSTFLLPALKYYED